MRKHFICLFALLLLFGKSSFAQEIGMVGSNGPVITYSNPSLILSQWNEFLSTYAAIDANHTTLGILSDGEGHYALVGSGGGYKSSIMLDYNASTGRLSVGVSKTVCTTKDCSENDGCEAKWSGGCTKCDGDCTKTTSNVAIFNL
ncbi:MAG: hypothetical protein EOP49_09965 [Sphingobacteriales bacterium]|nr:MAG: hypothetical protein EOP49_09965 [Sphingobacteriales bacterium]